MILKLKDGDVKIELFPDVAPNHVERIKTLANDGKYDNVFTLDSPSYISPIIINGTMIFYTEDAEVIAYR